MNLFFQDSDPTDTITPCNVGVAGLEETLGQTIYKISHEIFSICSNGIDEHANTMLLFELLSHLRWDAKVVLALSALTSTYGELLLVLQQLPHSPLAALVAALKQLPRNLTALKIQFKALNLLINTMVELAKTIVRFEGLPLQLVLLDHQAIAATKSKICIATYWILRSSLSCFSLLADLRTVKDEQVHSNRTAIASWALFSLVYKLSGLYHELREQVDVCCQQIETRFPEELLNVFKLNHLDNQEVLQMLFALRDNLPLKNYSKEMQCGILELKGKEVMFLISKPEIFSMEKVFFLMQQTYDHPHRKNLQGSYVILWVPIATSDVWSHADEITFQFWSNSFPWFSIRQPRLLNSDVVQFIRREWNYNEEPIMVILNSDGVITNLNALDMVWIWGAKAFPFSTSKERELWENQKWSLQFITDGIDPLLSHWVEEGEKYICIYGSDDIDWIRNFNSRMDKIKRTGVQLEVIYVGWRNPTENIIDAIRQENSSVVFLSFTKMQLFWLRMDSIRNSVMRLGIDSNVKGEVMGLLDAVENRKQWGVIGKGSSSPEIITLHDRKLQECFDLFSEWGESVGKLGLLGAIRTAMESPLPSKPCYHSVTLPYQKEVSQETVFCSQCRRPMEKYVVYKCDVTDSTVE
nr:protein SIEVE ELEMENT OCCLUSION C [Ipomoea batatas]